MAGRILVIQMAKLGDFIQSTPLLANLRKLRPGSKTVLAAEQPAVLEAARLSPLVDEVWAVDEHNPVPTGHFEAVYNLNSHSRPAALAAGVSAAARFGPQLKVGRTVFTPAQNFLMTLMAGSRRLGRFNLVDVWCSLAEGAGPEPLVWPKTGASEHLPAGPAFKIGLQLGCKNHLRRWPVEDFVALCAELAARGLDFKPVLLGAADERALGLKFKKLLNGQGPEPLDLIGATDLKALGEVATGLDLLITADTGVMHLAAAVGTAVLALFFGPAYGPETGPYGSDHLIYQALADCAPCRESGDCRRRQCLSRPDPRLAADLAEARLTGRPPAEMSAEQWPEGHRVWRTTADDFGQGLAPLGRPGLSPAELAALVLTEAGREIIRPAYQARPEKVAERLRDYGLTEPVAFDIKCFRRDQDGRTGLSEAVSGRALELARALGLEIASS